jgi:hypothetical protein
MVESQNRTKVQGVASVKIRVTLHARQLDKGAAAPRQTAT